MDLERCVFHQRTGGNADAEALHPLSALEKLDPDAYARAFAKYDDTLERRRLRETWIPGIEAGWTEVVFQTPLRPHVIWQAWKDIAGVELPSQEFWAIPIEAIGDAVTLDRQLTSTGDPIDPREVASIDVAAYRSQTETTSRNRQWIAELAAVGKRGAWFNGTPHVLTRGPVPLRTAEVIDWRTAGE